MLLKHLLEFLTGYKVQVLLPPGGSIIGMVDGNSLHLFIVNGHMNDHLVEPGPDLLNHLSVHLAP